MTLTFSEAQLQLVSIEAEAEAEVLTCTCTGGWKTTSNFFSFFEQFLFQFRKMQMLLKISLFDFEPKENQIVFQWQLVGAQR